VFILVVAAFRSYPVPPIFLNQLNDVPHLHGVTIILPPKTVNARHAELLFNYVHGLSRLQVAGVYDYGVAAAGEGKLRAGMVADQPLR
jgi:hypothetical protein